MVAKTKTKKKTIKKAPKKLAGKVGETVDAFGIKISIPTLSDVAGTPAPKKGRRKYTKAQQKGARKLWVKALRSGEYKQGRGELKSPNGRMCCLGVACDLAIQKGIVKGMKWEGGYVKVPNKKGNGDYDYSSAIFLPVQVMDWLGIRTNDGAYTERTEGTSLAVKNDRRTVTGRQTNTFKRIADIIEREPEGLVE